MRRPGIWLYLKYWPLVAYEATAAAFRATTNGYYALTTWQDADGRKMGVADSRIGSVMAISRTPWNLTVCLGMLGDLPTFRERISVRPASGMPMMIKEYPMGNRLYLDLSEGQIRTTLQDMSGNLIHVATYRTSRETRSRIRKVLLEERLSQRHGIGLPVFRRRKGA